MNDDRMARPICSIMTAEVWTVKPATRLDDAIRLLLERGISGMPVVDDAGAVVGVVTLTDIAQRLRGEAPEGTVFYGKEQVAQLLEFLVDERPISGAVREVMSRRLIAVAPEATIREAARLMVGARVHRVLVTDAGGKLAGIVSTLDIVDYVSKVAP